MPMLSWTATKRFHRIWTSAGDDLSQPLRRVRPGMVGSPRVARATGIAPSTIGRGLTELACGSDLPDDCVRRAGGGRKKLVGDRHGATGRLAGAGLAGRAWRSDVAAALDLQEPAPPGCRAGRAWPHKQPHGGGRVAEAATGSASRPIARRARGTAIRIGTRSSPTSTPA